MLGQFRADIDRGLALAERQGLSPEWVSGPALAWAAGRNLAPAAVPTRVPATADAVWAELTKDRDGGTATGLSDLAWSVACDRRTDADDPEHPRPKSISDLAFVGLLRRLFPSTLDAARRRFRGRLPDDELEDGVNQAWAQVHRTYWTESAGDRYLGLVSLGSVVAAVAGRRLHAATRNRAAGEGVRPDWLVAYIQQVKDFPGPGEIGQFLGPHRLGAFDEAVGVLPPTQALFSYGYHVGGLNRQQLARTYGCGRMTVHRALDRAWERLAADPSARVRCDVPPDPVPPTPAAANRAVVPMTVPRELERVMEAVYSAPAAGRTALTGHELAAIELLAAIRDGSSVEDIDEGRLGACVQTLGAGASVEAVAREERGGGDKEDAIEVILRLCPPPPDAIRQLIAQVGSYLLPSAAGTESLTADVPRALFATRLAAGEVASWASCRSYSDRPPPCRAVTADSPPGAVTWADGVVRVDTPALAPGRWHVYELGNPKGGRLDREPVAVFPAAGPPPAGPPLRLVKDGFLLAAWQAALGAGWGESRVRTLLWLALAEMEVLFKEIRAAVPDPAALPDFAEIVSQNLAALKQGLKEDLCG